MARSVASRLHDERLGRGVRERGRQRLEPAEPSQQRLEVVEELVVAQRREVLERDARRAVRGRRGGRADVRRVAALDVLGSPEHGVHEHLDERRRHLGERLERAQLRRELLLRGRVDAPPAAAALGRGGREPEQRLEELLREVAPHRVHLRVELARHRRERRAVAEQLLRGELLQRAEERAHGARHRELGARLLSAPRMRDERRKELGPFVRPVVARDLGAEHRELHGDLPVALAHRSLGEHERFEPRAFVGRDHAHVGAAARPPRALHGVLEADHRHQPPLHVERVAARDDLAEHVDEARDLLALPQRPSAAACRVVDVQRLLDRAYTAAECCALRPPATPYPPRRDTLQFKYGPYRRAHFDGDRQSTVRPKSLANLAIRPEMIVSSLIAEIRHLVDP